GEGEGDAERSEHRVDQLLGLGERLERKGEPEELGGADVEGGGGGGLGPGAVHSLPPQTGEDEGAAQVDVEGHLGASLAGPALEDPGGRAGLAAADLQAGDE